jgi:hypothetical protein
VQILCARRHGHARLIQSRGVSIAMTATCHRSTPPEIWAGEIRFRRGRIRPSSPDTTRDRAVAVAAPVDASKEPGGWVGWSPPRVPGKNDVHPGRASPRRPRAPLVSLVPADARRAQLLFSRSSMDAHLTWRCRSGTYASCLTKPSWYAMSRWENDRTTGFGWAGHLTHAAESSFVLFLFSSFLSTPITKRGGGGHQFPFT